MKYIYPGSFDPITYGHADIIRRGRNLCGRMVVAVLDNPAKNLVFTASERAEMIAGCLDEFGIEAEVDVFLGLLADYVVRRGACAILRGVRNPLDFAAEERYAIFNRMLGKGAETVLLPSSPKFSYLSSSIVKEAAKLAYENGPECDTIAEWVPRNVVAALRSKFSKE